ncbi:MAG: DMT family transporter, partial [Mobilitalea sp.]
ALLYVILAASMWGTIGISIRIISQFHFSPIQMVVARLLTADVFIGGFLLVTDRNKFKIKLKDIKWFLGIGILSVLFFNTCYCITVQMTSLSIAAVLLYTSPVFVMLLSIPIFKEKITKYKLMAIILSVIGCALVSGIFSSDIAQISQKGLIFGICAAVGYAFYSIFARILLTKYHSFTIIFYTFLIAGVGGTFLGNVPGIVNICVETPIAIVAIIGSALTCSVLPYILYTKALVHMEASRASVIASVEPVVATVIGIFVFAEKITIAAVLGIICVLAAIGILNAKQN